MKKLLEIDEIDSVENLELFENFSNDYGRVKYINEEVFNKIHQHKLENYEDVFGGEGVFAKTNNSHTALIKSRLTQAEFMRQLVKVIEDNIENEESRSFKRASGDLSAEIKIKFAENASVVTKPLKMFGVLIGILTDEELESNKINRTIWVNGRRFDSGMRVTKLLATLDKKYLILNDHLREYYLNNLRYDSNKSRDFYLSINPSAIVFGGILGQSCLSPNGCNQHGSFDLLGIKEAAIVFDKNMEERSFVMLSKKNKEFSVLKTFPNRNFALTMSVWKHFTSLGYKYVRYSTGVYQDCYSYTDFGNDEILESKQAENASDIELINYEEGLFGGVPEELGIAYARYFSEYNDEIIFIDQASAEEFDEDNYEEEDWEPEIMECPVTMNEIYEDESRYSDLLRLWVDPSVTSLQNNIVFDREYLHEELKPEELKGVKNAWLHLPSETMAENSKGRFNEIENENDDCGIKIPINSLVPVINELEFNEIALDSVLVQLIDEYGLVSVSSLHTHIKSYYYADRFAGWKIIVE